MIRTIGPARLGFAAALLALLLGPLALGSHTAHAQGPDVAQYYGTGLSEGDAVGAWIGDTECASTTANAAGEWVVGVGQDDCSPENGDTVNFSLNGSVAEQTATWSAGDLSEVTLTVSAMPDDAMPDTPAVPDTGNAGLVGSAGSASLLALALGSLALVGLAAARLATRRVS